MIWKTDYETLPRDELRALQADVWADFAARGITVDLEKELKPNKVPQEGADGTF